MSSIETYSRTLRYFQILMCVKIRHLLYNEKLKNIEQSLYNTPSQHTLVKFQLNKIAHLLISYCRVIVMVDWHYSTVQPMLAIPTNSIRMMG